MILAGVVAGIGGLDAATETFIARISSPPNDTWIAGYDAAFRYPGFKTALTKLDALYDVRAYDTQSASLNWCSTSFELTESGFVTQIPLWGYSTDGTTGFLDTHALHNGLTQFTQNSAVIGFHLAQVYSGGNQSGSLHGVASGTSLVTATLANGGVSQLRLNQSSNMSPSPTPAQLNVQDCWIIFRRTGAALTEILQYTTGGGLVSLATGTGTSAALAAVDLTILKTTSVFANTYYRVGAYFVGSGSMSNSEIGAIIGGLAAKQAIVTPSPVAPYTSASFVSSTVFPDASAQQDAGKGLGCVGMDFDTADSTFWVGHFGRANAGSSTPYAPMIIHVSDVRVPGAISKLLEIDVSAEFTTTTPGLQGIAVDPDRGTVWACGLSSANIHEYNKTTGALVSSITGSSSAHNNGLAYDTILNCLISARDDATDIRWLDPATGKMRRWQILPDTPDQISFVNAGDQGQIWYSYGLNDEPGHLAIWDIATATKLVDITLSDTLAIEQVWKDPVSSTLYASCDHWFHGSTLNTCDKYALS